MTDPLAKLFGSPARVRLLRLFLFNPRSSFSAAEAASRAVVSIELARTELRLFAQTGLIKPTARRGTKRFALDVDFAYRSALQSLLLNAPARAEDLPERLKGAGSLKLIITSGIFMGEWDGRLDIFIVGDRVSDRKLRAKMRSLESEVGRELRYAVLSTPDFFYRLNMSDKLVRDIMDYPHEIVFDKLNIGLK